jgi:ubiquitin thioesterase OTU1
LRQDCIGEIRSNPSKFSEAAVASSAEAYCPFLENPDHWGGYIEMEILSRCYKFEICVLRIEECNMVPVHSCQTMKRTMTMTIMMKDWSSRVKHTRES